MITINNNRFSLHNIESWNNELLDYKEASIFNTGQYGIVGAILSGDDPARSVFFLDFLKDGIKVGKSMVISQRTHALYSSLLIRSGLKGIAPFFKTITWWHAPLLSETVYGDEILEHFLDWVDDFARKARVFAVEGATPPAHLDYPENAFSGVYEKFGYSKIPMASVVLYLDKFKTKEDCWDNISHDARTKVKKAIKDGIQIIEDVDLKFLSEFIKLQQKSGYSNLPFYKNEKLFRSVADIYNSGNMCRLFVSVKDGKVLSGQVLFIFNRAIILEGVVISGLVRKNRWYANDLMQWYIINWAKEKGFRIIDWGGFALNPSEKEKRINDFKLKWGGSVSRFYAYSKAFIPWKYRFFKALKNLKANCNA